MARNKGAKGKKTKANREQLLDELEARGRKTPLEFLTKLYSNRRRPMDTRVEAAKACLPYFHRKQPIDLVIDGDITFIPPYIPSKALLAEDYKDELGEDNGGKSS